MLTVAPNVLTAITVKEKCFSYFYSNSRGKVIKALQYQSTVAPGTVARVEPNIKWFGKYVHVYYILGGKNCSSVNVMLWI